MKVELQIRNDRLSLFNGAYDVTESESFGRVLRGRVDATSHPRARWAASAL
jgi:hypothetical protein